MCWRARFRRLGWELFCPYRLHGRGMRNIPRNSPNRKRHLRLTRRHCRKRAESTMRVLVVHESYQQRGGEDAVAAAEARQLELHGHTVLRYSRHNDELKGNGLLQIIG